MRVDVVTKEYPPEVYGGAGVHVAELVRALRRLDGLETRVHAFGELRDERLTTSYGDLAELAGANAAVKTMGVDLAIVLAGGEGKRLMPLTADRAKPAVPFGGDYRLVDFVLSNLVNGGYLKIVVLTQYKSHSLDRHIATTWRMSPLLGNYVTPAPEATCWSTICRGSMR